MGHCTLSSVRYGNDPGLGTIHYGDRISGSHTFSEWRAEGYENDVYWSNTRFWVNLIPRTP